MDVNLNRKLNLLYPENIEQKLDFVPIRGLLSAMCSSPLGRERVDAMQMMTDVTDIRHRLALGREMQRVCHNPELGFPEGEIFDLREALSRIRIEGLYLDEQELDYLRRTLRYAIALDTFFRNLPEKEYPTIRTLPAPLRGEENIDPTDEKVGKVGGEILKTLDRILDQFGRLQDNASPELSRIRHEIHAAEGSVSRSLIQILKRAQADGIVDKDASPTLREGRMVIPVPPAYKRKIGGIVHDESATGKTVFIEPPEVVETNNRIRELEAEERREHIRILKDISNRIRPAVPEILGYNQMLSEVDFLNAQVRLADQLHAIAPEIQDEPMLDLREARHPVLFLNFQKQGKTVVPLTLRLTDKRILIISGPNAGGKSVCLKTIALLQYMVQCGLMVPVRENSTMGIFHSLMIDIGDQQSIADDLSTYSGHLRNMKAFVRSADHRTLILIDEFGSGTEPLIGGAIAEAVLDQLREQQVFGVITTHYTNLKHYAEQHDGVINGAMLYDRGALRPLFQLSVGQAGSSFAIEIARQTGLPDSIIRHATELVGEEHIDYDKQLQDIARDKRYWAEKRKAIHEREKQLEEKIAYYEHEIGGIKQKRKEIIAKANDEAAEILQRSNATIERTIREIKEAQADKEKTKAARAKVEALKAKTPRPPKGGEVHTIDSEKADNGKKGQKKVLRDFRDLKQMGKTLAQQTPQNTPPHLGGRGVSPVVDTIRSRKLSFNRTLDIRGMRADEALETFIAYLDDAVMVAAGEVTILHGTGTGALKQVVRDYLNQYNRALRRRGAGELVFHDGDVNTGGAGLTVIEL